MYVQRVQPTDRTSLRLNAPLVRVLMWGAGMTYDSDIARATGVSKSHVSRALNGQTAPSAELIDGLARLFPCAPYDRIVVPTAADVEPPESFGLTDVDVREPERQ